MTPAENKAVVRRFYEAIDRGDLAALHDLVAEDYENHAPPSLPGLPPAREGLEEAFRIFWKATPGRHVIEEMVAERDLVVTRLAAYGRHAGDLPGAPATGNELEMRAIAIHRVVDGRIVEHWSGKDDLGFLRQIGILPGDSS